MSQNISLPANVEWSAVFLNELHYICCYSDDCASCPLGATAMTLAAALYGGYRPCRLCFPTWVEDLPGPRVMPWEATTGQAQGSGEPTASASAAPDTATAALLSTTSWTYVDDTVQVSAEAEEAAESSQPSMDTQIDNPEQSGMEDSDDTPRTRVSYSEVD